MHTIIIFLIYLSVYASLYVHEQLYSVRPGWSMIYDISYYVIMKVCVP